MSNTVRASHVGVYTTPQPGRYTRATCARCGRRRIVRLDRPHDLCRDCQMVDPEFGSTQPEKEASP